jgi:anaerobic selenocysteine-containing dehydrogenase
MSRDTRARGKAPRKTEPSKPLFESTATRRGFLKVGAATAVGLTASACDRGRDPYAILKPPVPGPPYVRGQETTVVSSCAQCPLGCGVVARVVENRAVHLEGNPDHPVNQGGLGPRGQSGLEALYASNRIRGPMRRRGGSRNSAWETVSWDQAIKEVGDKLRELQAAGPEGLVVLSGRERGVVRDLWARFCSSFGTPNFIEHSRRGSSGTLGRATAHALGDSDIPSYDIAHAGIVLSLGAALAEATCMGTLAARTRAQARHSLLERRMQLFHVESAYSLSAALADEWIAVKPGTLDFFAMGIARVLITKGLYDRAFVAEHVFGFDPWTDAQGKRHQGFAQLAEELGGARASELTGVRAETFERVAHALAEIPPAVVVVDDRSAEGSNGLSVVRSALALNALLGTISRPGGLITQRPPPFADWPPLPANSSPRRPRIDSAALARFPLALSAPDSLAAAISTSQPYPAKAVFFYYTNPLHGLAGAPALRQALAKVPLTVSFSPFEDETTVVADYVLPDHTYLERLEDAAIGPSVGTPVVGIRQPVVVPLYETRHTGDVILGLAKAVGGTPAVALPWTSFEDAFLVRLSGVRALQRGSFTAKDDKEFLETLRKRGFWMDDPARGATRTFATPSGKFELYAQTVAAAYAKVPDLAGALKDAGVTSLDALALGAPTAAQWKGEPDHYPLYLLPYRSTWDAVGGPPMENLLEVGDPLTGARWSIPVEMNPKTASALGLSDGQKVLITSPSQSLGARLRLFEGVPPGAVRMALSRGTGQESDRLPNVRSLLAAVPNPMGATPVASARVRVERAS